MDSFYYYAPVPRVRKLRKVLSRAGIKPAKLLVQDPLISVDAILNMLTYWLKGGAKPAGIILSMVKSRRVDVVKLSRDSEVGEERAAFLDFLVFVLRGDADEATRKLRKGICHSGSAVRLGSKVRDNLRKFVRADMSVLKDFIPLDRYRGKLAGLYSEYMICRACKVLGVKYPRAVAKVPFKYGGKSDVRLHHFIAGKARECTGLCDLGDHWEDVGRAASLLNYVSNHGGPVYVATVAALSPQRVATECFSCIIRALSAGSEVKDLSLMIRR